MPYAAVSAEPAMTPTSATIPQPAPSVASCRSAVSAVSFATKPSVGMTPAIEAIERKAAVAMTGAWRPRPESSPMSRVES